MGRNLTTLQIKDSFQHLLQLSGSALNDGTGSLVESIDVTASFAESSSFATSASVADTSGYAGTSGYANTAGEGLANFELAGYNSTTGTITLTRSNATQQNVVLSSVPYAETSGFAEQAGTSGFAVSASYATFASGAVDVNAIYTGSATDGTITFEKGDGSTFEIVIDNISTASFAEQAGTAGFASQAGTSGYASTAGLALTASYAPDYVETASYSNPNLTFTKGDGSTFSVEISTDTPSLQEVTDVGNSTTNAITASGAWLNGDTTISGDLEVNGTITYVSSSHLQIGDNIIEINYNRAVGNSGMIVYDTTSPYTASMLWDATTDRWIAGPYGSEETIILASDTGSMNVQYAENTIITIKNMEASTIAKGTPCYISASGASGNVAGVYIADASNPNRMPASVIAGETLTNPGDEGIGLLDGTITGVDTSLFDSGDKVYVAVGGGYTNVAPTGSANLVQVLGNVEKVHPSNGSGVIQMAGESRNVPNIQDGYTWVGDSDGVAQPTDVSTLSVAFASQAGTSGYAVTASYALTASSLETPLNLQEVTDVGNVTTNDIIAAKLSGSSLEIIGDIAGTTTNNEHYTLYHDITTNYTTPNLFVNAQKPGQASADINNPAQLEDGNIVIGGASSVSNPAGIRDGASYSNKIIGEGVIERGQGNLLISPSAFAYIGESGSASSNFNFRNNILISNNSTINYGSSNLIIGGDNHDLTADSSTLSLYNQARSIVGGYGVEISGSRYAGAFGADSATITNSAGAVAVGGYRNEITGASYTAYYYGGIFAGQDNSLSGENGVVLGGNNNNVTDSNSAVVGGSYNNATGQNAVVLGGQSNTASGLRSGVLACESSTASGQMAVAIGGYGHNVAGPEAGAYSGDRNTINARGYTLGGNNHTINTDANYSAIVAGGNNTIATGHTGSVILGGYGLSTTKSDEVVVPNLSVYGDVLGTGSISLGDNRSNTFDLSTTSYSAQIASISSSMSNGNNKAQIATRQSTNSSTNENNVQIGTREATLSATGVGNGQYSAEYSTLGGSSSVCVIVGGYGNSMNNAGYSSIMGGESNAVNVGYSHVIGSIGSQITGGSKNIILGGDTHTISDSLTGVAIIGGTSITATESNTAYVPNLVVSGSAKSEVQQISISSNTGSMDCSTGNFFEITLQNGVDTQLEASNIANGQTITLKVTNNGTASGTLSYGSNIEFANGTPFVVTSATNAVDIITFVSFDSTLYGTGLTNFS